MYDSHEPLYDCPVCLGLKMVKLHFNGKQEMDLVLDYCQHCGGIWFDQGEMQQLRQYPIRHVERKLELRPHDYQMQCHHCHARMDRNAAACPVCGWQNILECPVCQQKMKVREIEEVKLDYCNTCKGVWFDNIELSMLWNRYLDRAAHQHLSDSGKASSEKTEFFVEVLAFNPDLAFYAGYYGGRAAIEGTEALVSSFPNVATHMIEGTASFISQAPEMAGTIVEGVADASGSIFEVIADIISGLFS